MAGRSINDADSSWSEPRRARLLVMSAGAGGGAAVPPRARVASVGSRRAVVRASDNIYDPGYARVLAPDPDDFGGTGIGDDSGDGNGGGGGGGGGGRGGGLCGLGRWRVAWRVAALLVALVVFAAVCALALAPAIEAVLARRLVAGVSVAVGGMRLGSEECAAAAVLGGSAPQCDNATLVVVANYTIQHSETRSLPGLFRASATLGTLEATLWWNGSETGGKGWCICSVCEYILWEFCFVGWCGFL
jgi:hypothetical protein